MRDRREKSRWPASPTFGISSPTHKAGMKKQHAAEERETRHDDSHPRKTAGPQLDQIHPHAGPRSPLHGIPGGLTIGAPDCPPRRVPRHAGRKEQRLKPPPLSSAPRQASSTMEPGPLRPSSFLHALEGGVPAALKCVAPPPYLQTTTKSLETG
jgi:hypothetical protein